MSVGSRISKLRKLKGWTQAQLAQQAQLSASSIAMYETGRRSPDHAVLMKLASALQVKEIELLDDGAAAGSKQDESGSMQPSQSDEQLKPAATPQKAASEVTESGINLTTFSLTSQEARMILFLRMNPDCSPFLESYIKAERSKREQLEATWRLIQEFHPG